MGLLSTLLIAAFAVAVVSAVPHYNCPVPHAPQYGRYYSSDHYKGSTDYGIGHVIYYECDDGYDLHGTDWDACTYDSSTYKADWRYPTPVCKRTYVDCGDLDDPHYGVVEYSSTTVPSEATYSCHEGYFLIGLKTRICQANGKWHGSAPVCKPVICGDLHAPDYGAVDYSYTHYGSKATYSCRHGYYLVGAETRICQADGKWSNYAPTCKKHIDCGDLDAPDYGAVDYSSTNYGSKATYSCNYGLYLVGEKTRVCQYDGKWSGEAPICKHKDCGDLDAPDYGTVDYSSTYYGAEATYSCNHGLYLVGEKTRVCQYDGTWAGDAPICKHISCGDLDAPDYGDVDYSSTYYGAEATYSCHHGAYLVGKKTRVCQYDGTWAGDAPICKHISCGDLDAPDYGDVDYSSTYYGAKATYSCHHGAYLVGEKTRVCQYDGTWAGDAPICKHISCDDLHAPDYGAVDYSSTYYGAKATYSCNYGAYLVGEKTRVCQYDGTWAGDAPICKHKDCGDLDAPDYGAVDYSSTYYGAKATYSCHYGFYLVGEKTRVCQGNGKWSGDAPICKHKDCGDLDAPDHGAVDYSSTYYGAKATYSCKYGFYLVGEKTRVCQGYGKWSGDAPICKHKDCGELADPDYGTVEVDSTYYGSKAVYSCNYGLILEGDKTRVCQGNGKWSGDAPICKHIDCDDLDDPDYGSVEYNSTYYGAEATYSCHHGAYLVGKKTRVCQYDGTWAGDAPICKHISCGDLDEPDYGTVDYSSTYYGAKATYSCNYGYYLVGEKTRVCQYNGTWAGDAPICKHISCNDLDAPHYGAVDYSNTHYGSKATYSCHKGYYLVGKKTRVCQAYGKWAGDAPVCKPVDCGDPHVPDYGEVKYKATTFKSVATHSCKYGYHLVGQKKRTCQYNGKWSGPDRVCKPVKCGKLKAPDYGAVHVSSLFYGSKATYSCNHGYVLVGDKTRVCQGNKKWSGKAPICKPVDCGDLDAPDYGDVDYSSTYYGAKATYSCNYGAYLVGEKTRVCQYDGKWSGDAPVCKHISCGDLDAPDYGDVDYSSTYYGAEATYSCNHGAYLVGEKTRVCQYDGTWAGDAPVCKHISCGDLDAPGYGAVDYSSTYYGAKATYSCNHGAVLVGEKTRVCQYDGKWSGDAPICKHLSCGNLPNPDYGIVSLTGTAVGSKATYDCNKGFELVGERKRECLYNGKWSGEAPTCEHSVVHCGDPHPPPYGQVKYSCTTYNCKVYYSCNVGYSLYGNDKRVCQYDGSWSGSQPKCAHHY